MLLSRDKFREGVFRRDDYKCVACSKPAVDAHHIIERRLFDDGGYYLDNGASLCGDCHLDAERTVITCETLRENIGIEKAVLPSHLYPDIRYDKWGNPWLNDVLRMRGELFHDESVQKILVGEFSSYVKYPRTYHLPFSPGCTSDDRIIEDCRMFDGKDVEITEKYDGENFTIYKDYCHARSLDSMNHASRTWVKNFHGKIQYDIPEGWRVCMENLHQSKSIRYLDLSTFAYGFSIWNDRNVCLSVDDMEEWFALIGITPVRTVYRGKWDEGALKEIIGSTDSDKVEGYVVRLSESFRYVDFRRSVAKYVRKGHVQTSHHWMRELPRYNQINRK